MVRFGIRKNKIELIEYSEDASLAELADVLDAFRLKNRLKTKNCRGCGKCCIDDIPVLGLDFQQLIQGLKLDSQSPGSCMQGLIEKSLLCPEPPDIGARRREIKKMAKEHGMSETEAAFLYEYNNADPFILKKGPDGMCFLLENKLCSIYQSRLYICSLYLCNMGERLSCLQEMIVRQGTWHAYSIMGWIPEEEIAHNPFLGARTFGEVPVRKFETGLHTGLEELFFYF